MPENAMKVKLQDVVDQMQMQSGESASYLNKKTGELFMLGEDEMLGLDLEDDDEEELDDFPEWQRESRQKAREINESDDWIELPTQRDVHEYHIMEQFGASLDNAEARDRILQTIRGSGAFRRFKHALDDLGLWDEWNSFKSAEIERMAVEWLGENQIPYSREPDATQAASSAI
jgi:hypothetical protein